MSENPNWSFLILVYDARKFETADISVGDRLLIHAHNDIYFQIVRAFSCMEHDYEDFEIVWFLSDETISQKI